MKNQNKIILIIFTLIFFTSTIHAASIDEKTFYELGENDFSFVKDTNICKNYDFNELNTTENATFVTQIKIKNYIPINSGVEINIYLNNEKIGEIKDKNIKENNIFKKENINLQKKNTLTICVNNKFLPELIISKESKIGNYLLPKFNEMDFYQTLSEYDYTQNILTIQIHVTNSGYDDANIEIINAKEIFLELSNLENISGTTEYSGIIKAGETKELSYYIKPTKQTSYITPRAILKYTDEFGETHIIYTKQQVIEIQDPDTKIQAYTDVPTNTIKNQETNGKLIIRNISEKELNSIYIIPEFNGNILMDSQEIPILKGRDTISIPFKIKTTETGEFPLYFNITYKENTNTKSIVTETNTINSMAENKNETIILCILIGIMIILYIWLVRF
ncbi:MAG TPA: hypothetical protein PKK56_00145 [archaeon]|nr:hypothetical protein [archaeon]